MIVENWNRQTQNLKPIVLTLIGVRGCKIWREKGSQPQVERDSPKKKQKKWLSTIVSTAGYSRYDNGGAANSVAWSWRESEKIESAACKKIFLSCSENHSYIYNDNWVILERAITSVQFPLCPTSCNSKTRLGTIKTWRRERESQRC